MTDKNQNIVWEGEFLPFGEPFSVTVTVTNNLRFPGQYYDSETGLHQNWHRDYKSEVGRYVEADPILQPMINLHTTNSGCANSRLTWRVPRLISNPQDLHPFFYTKENPINLIDPMGLVCGSGWTDKIVPDYYGSFDFTAACTEHDKCYETCSTSSVHKLVCDSLFLNDMLYECRKLTWYPISQFSCIETATIYYTAVFTVGRPSYKKAQQKACCK